MRPRIGLVLGSGGVLGAAWMTGALAALQERLPVPAGQLDVLVGTSAGSVLVAALRSGLSVQSLVEYQRAASRGEHAAVRRDRVTVLTPGPEDLAAMGANLMDPARRAKVFDSSLRTSVQALAIAHSPRAVRPTRA